MPKKTSGGTSRITVKSSSTTNEVIANAARELAGGLGAMLGRDAAVQSDPALEQHAIIVSFGSDAGVNDAPSALADDSFEVSRPNKGSLAIHAGSARGSLRIIPGRRWARSRS
jgi:hypothetical protein